MYQTSSSEDVRVYDTEFGMNTRCKICTSVFVVLAGGRVHYWMRPRPRPTIVRPRPHNLASRPQAGADADLKALTSLCNTELTHEVDLFRRHAKHNWRPARPSRMRAYAYRAVVGFWKVVRPFCPLPNPCRNGEVIAVIKLHLITPTSNISLGYTG